MGWGIGRGWESFVAVIVKNVVEIYKYFLGI